MSKKISVHTHTLQIFRATTDHVAIAKRTGGAYCNKTGAITLEYLGYTCIITQQGEITVDNNSLNLTPNEETLIRQYLLQSSGAEPRGTWISFLQLPDGPHHHVPFKLEAMDPLAKTYGADPKQLLNFAMQFKGEAIDMADCGVILPVFPKLPMVLAVWAGDEEFPPSGNVLFDANAPLHLTTAGLWVLGVAVVGRFTRADRISHL